MDIALEDEMKKITESLGRSVHGVACAGHTPAMHHPKAPPPANGPEIPNTLLDRLDLIRANVAAFDAEIRNDLADLDADLAAMHAGISARIGIR